ncbi:hypothetical protein HPB49_002267 [Dermacentor silvarum]|uniref:Uncharacterized protein n=1 Tax=Dermacentor silvarum TaxID=543639 RepID=A0ACB8CCX0_DERSI|nr:uncharacterized protein LOC119458627 [Dermacentor silvarum]KAH7940580.1 hypothetical protein HPB49_002267 [Dermacentor silvarum]
MGLFGILHWAALTRRQTFFYIVSWFITSITLLILELKYLPQVFREMDLLWSGFVFHTPGCKMPFYDPYHWTIKHSALKTTYNYDNYCAYATRPNAVRQALDVFTLDENVLEGHYNASVNETDCYYQVVLRNMTASVPDVEPVLGPRVRVVFGRPLRQEYIRISCEANGEPLFSDCFFVPVDKRDAGEARSRGQLNVLILGVDSTSRLNFHRRMSRTRRLLVDERGAYEFLVYNKVGLNSFPNLIPLLTGLSSADVTSLFRNNHYDSLPAIWKVYKSLGYATLYLEEMPDWGIFAGAYGFKEAPTDYYTHPMMLLMDKNTSDPVRCMGGRLKTKEVLRYVADILKFHKDRRLFAYVWLSYMSHDSVDHVAYMDAPLERFFKELSASGVMDSTAVLFLSDHGMRQGAFRMTEIGRHEDKTPFGLWVFPRRFLSEHPEVAVFLEVNQRRLVTTYDFHATLLSIASLPKLSALPSNKGLSLFGPVPPERTCEDAFVPQAFCACIGTEKKLDDASMSQSFALFAVAHMNALAEAHFPGKCATWSLDSVNGATVFGGSVAGKVLIRVSLKTLPEAYFDVYGGVRNASSWEKHVDFVDRTDSYANKTACLEKSSWQKVCNCKDQT